MAFRRWRLRHSYTMLRRWLADVRSATGWHVPCVTVRCSEVTSFGRLTATLVVLFVLALGCALAVATLLDDIKEAVAAAGAHWLPPVQSSSRLSSLSRSCGAALTAGAVTLPSTCGALYGIGARIAIGSSTASLPLHATLPAAREVERSHQRACSRSERRAL